MSRFPEETSIYSAASGNLNGRMNFMPNCMHIVKKKKILFLCSAFGQESAGKLIRTGAEIMKIASPELGFHELRNAVLASGIPVIFSTGVKYQDDITAAVSDLTAECYPAENLYGLHCVTSYPAAENEMNVSALVGLTAACKVPFGLSDHSIDPYFIPSLAACVFSSSQNTAGKVFILEKHLTLTNDDGGLDDPIAVQGKDFGLLFTLLGKIRQSAFRNNLRLNHAACSTADTNSAADIRDYAGLCAEIIREAALNCGVGNIFDEGINFNERITAALGDGIKQPSVSEESIYRTTNRSLLAVRDIAQGDLITENNARYLRSEKNLTPGLGMQHWRVIGNARARNPVRNGSGIQLSDLEI